MPRVDAQDYKVNKVTSPYHQETWDQIALTSPTLLAQLVTPGFSARLRRPSSTNVPGHLGPEAFGEPLARYQIGLQGLDEMMARPVGRGPHLEPNSFQVLEDEQSFFPHISQKNNASVGIRDALDELPVDFCLNQKVVRGPSQEKSLAGIHDRKPQQKPTTTGTPSFPDRPGKPKQVAPRRRRPLIEPETFEPLDAVQEEDSCTMGSENSVIVSPSQGADRHLGPPAPSHSSHLDNLTNHPLVVAEHSLSIRDEVEKHLAGQFEWLITCPPSAGSADHRGSHDEDEIGRDNGNTVFGCNLLPRNQGSYSKVTKDGQPSANKFTLLATPLRDASLLRDLRESLGAASSAEMVWEEPPLFQGTPVKAQEFERVHQPVSPSSTVVSERSGSFQDGSPVPGASSLQRIEDSLEELDRLEDQLEAVDAFTRSRRVAARTDGKPSNPGPKMPSEAKTSKPMKRASVAGQAMTVRIKTVEKANPTLRRSASLNLRDKKPQTGNTAPEQKADGTLSRGRLVNGRPTAAKPTAAKPTAAKPTAAKPPVKSARAPTEAKFELPGEAVGRRLKEQREMRLAQQAEAEKANTPLPKARGLKPLPKPTFELPGEAISRRKREERERKLHAEAEEERKKREFKARPVRQSLGPSCQPRDTLASRARQSKISEENCAEREAELKRAKRMSMGVVRSAAIATDISGSPQARGRHSIIFPVDDASRATSLSAGSPGGKRVTLSAEEAAQQKVRGKTIFVRDNFSFVEDKERQRQQRESAAKAAREQAAERSRIASREWADKKRRKEQAMKGATPKAIPTY